MPRSHCNRNSAPQILPCTEVHDLQPVPRRRKKGHRKPCISTVAQERRRAHGTRVRQSWKRRSTTTQHPGGHRPRGSRLLLQRKDMITKNKHTLHQRYLITDSRRTRPHRGRGDHSDEVGGVVGAVAAQSSLDERLGRLVAYEHRKEVARKRLRVCVPLCSTAPPVASRSRSQDTRHAAAGTEPEITDATAIARRRSHPGKGDTLLLWQARQLRGTTHAKDEKTQVARCLLYTSPSPRD